MNDRLFWSDLETFGLIPSRDPVVEVGIIVTDLNLRVVDQRSWTIWSARHTRRLSEQVYNASSPSDVDPAFSKDEKFVLDMHTTSGLYEEAKENGFRPAVAELEIGDFLRAAGATKRDPLCGSSVAFDREMLREHLPSVDAILSYRIIDVSTLKELCSRLNPTMFSHMEEDIGWNAKDKAHRAIDDLHDSIAELKWYQDNFLWTDLDHG